MLVKGSVLAVHDYLRNNGNAVQHPLTISRTLRVHLATPERTQLTMNLSTRSRLEAAPTIK